jgi:riboflavin synthase
MFTGLIQAQGTITKATDDGHGGRTLTVRELGIAPLLALGESVAVNGVCLTVVASTAETFDFQVGPETVQKTVLAAIVEGTAVNLERALRVGDPIGGHFVTGHVDCTGAILERVTSGEWETVSFSFPKEFDELLVLKGSIAIDGVSLTLAKVESGKFAVMLIPHTLAQTTLGGKAIGDRVNLEFDLLAKHVQKLFKTLTLTV